MSKVVIETRDNRQLASFESDLDPNDASGCLALLRQEALHRKIRPASLVLIIKADDRARPREYRTS